MNIRNDRIEIELQELRSQSNIQVIMCQPDDISRIDLWIVWIKGAKGSLHQDAIYPIKITFPNNYPMISPRINFQKDFLHIHVYEGGQICLPILQEINWRSKINMNDIIRRIQSLIHQDINPYSPANINLFKIYQNQKEKYYHILKEQAQKYKQKKLQYFMQPSIHIDILNNNNNVKQQCQYVKQSYQCDKKL